MHLPSPCCFSLAPVLPVSLLRLPWWLLIDLSFPVCPSPSSATEVIGWITSLPYFNTSGVLRMKSKLCKETHRSPLAPGPWPTLLTSVARTLLPPLVLSSHWGTSSHPPCSPHSHLPLGHCLCCSPWLECFHHWLASDLSLDVPSSRKPSMIPPLSQRPPLWVSTAPSVAHFHCLNIFHPFEDSDYANDA